MRRLDRGAAIAFVDISNRDDPVACPLSRDALLARFHARDRDGQIHSGAAAFAVMWRTIPLLKPLGHAARIPLVLAALEWLYCRFLNVRPWLQKALKAR